MNGKIPLRKGPDVVIAGQTNRSKRSLLHRHFIPGRLGEKSVKQDILLRFLIETQGSKGLAAINGCYTPGAIGLKTGHTSVIKPVSVQVSRGIGQPQTTHSVNLRQHGRKINPPGNSGYMQITGMKY